MTRRSAYHPNIITTVCFTVIVLLCSFLIRKDKTIAVVFIGDSITQGAGIKDADKNAPPVYALSYLKEKKKIDVAGFSNQGVSGFTTINFLPSNGATFDRVLKAAQDLHVSSNQQLVFSMMLGTNDSAITGPLGSPVSASSYFNNLKVISDRLLLDFPNSIIIIHHPIWYSPNTQNGSKYLQEGLDRLQTYFPEIQKLVNAYKVSHPSRVFTGDQKGFKFFSKNYDKYFQHEEGKQGFFYLHPNEAGAKVLGDFWGEAVAKALKR